MLVNLEIEFSHSHTMFFIYIYCSLMMIVCETQLHLVAATEKMI